MNKLLVIIISLICISTLSYSQPKTEFGLTTEGSWFIPYKSIGHDWQTKAGFGTGVGVYASQNIFWRFSADLGLAYRYKQMQQHYAIYTGTDGGYNYGNSYGSANTGNSNFVYDYGSTHVEGWDKLSLHYIVVPVHLQMLLSKSFFIRGGMESTWLLNWEAVNEKPEYNWTAGFGSQKHKLKWSLNYIKGFKDQGFGNKTTETDGHYKGSINRNRMLQLNLSYPIWQKR